MNNNVSCHHYLNFSDLYTHFIHAAKTNSSQIADCREWEKWKGKGMIIPSKQDLTTLSKTEETAKYWFHDILQFYKR